MVVFVDPATGVEVDLLAANGNPETTVIREARPATVFGARAPVASLEHLLLLYLYSNQPRHLGDFASIVQSGKADLKKAGRLLREMHREMVPDWNRRVKQALSPPPAPPRPKNGRAHP